MPTIVSIAPRPAPVYDRDDPIPPFGCVELTDRAWRPMRTNPRFMPVEMYTEHLRGLDYKKLQEHARVRRKHTGEDLDASASREKLIDEMRFDGVDGDGGDGGGGD